MNGKANLFPMTKEQKEKAKADLRAKYHERQSDLFSYWLSLFEMNEEMRKHCGYSQGAEDMVKKLASAWRKEERKLMAAFDRGDYD